MMTLQEMLAEIPQLTAHERRLLIDALNRSLREEPLDLTSDVRTEREATVERLFGALRPDGQPRTDEELREDYTDYLSEKYS